MICRCGPRSSVRVFTADAVGTRASKRNDPTGTLPLQKRFQRELNSRWDTLRRTVPNFVTARTDLATTIGHAAITGQDPVRAFQKWFDTALKMVVVGDGRWMARFVREAGDAALMRSSTSLTRMDDADIHDADFDESKHPRDDKGKFTAAEAISRLHALPEITGVERHFDPGFGGPDYGPEVSVRSAGFERNLSPQILRQNEKTTLEHVPLDKLVLHQGSVTKGLVEKYINAPPSEPIEVVQYGDKFYAQSGHHRAVAAKMRGAATITANVRKRKIIKYDAAPPADRIPPLQTLAHTELQGIAEATSQQAVRAFANGLLTRKTPSAIARDVQAIIDKVGKTRANMLVSFITVRAFSAVTLDAYRAAGINRVGIEAERVTAIAPSFTRDAKGSKKKKKKASSSPDDLVEVLTAGDDNVCQQCQDISEDGPYTIDDAEDLIPAHPNCRCAFVPWGDERYADVHADDAGFDEDQHPRDKDGKFAFSNSAHDLEDPSLVAVPMSDNPPAFSRAVVAEQVRLGYEPAVKTVPVAKLRATQMELNAPDEDTSKKGALFPKYKDKPVIERENGTGLLHIVDGHNRISAAIRANKPIEAYVFEEVDLDKSTLDSLRKRHAVRDAGFNEELHPRDKDGKWTAGESLKAAQRADAARWDTVPNLASWTPPSDNAWRDVPGQNNKIFEPELPDLKTSWSYKHPVTGEMKTVHGEKRLSSGVIMREPDGRTWLVKPKNGFGGYKYTFPKGGVEPGLSPQANAIKEAYEESGLKARITGYAGDYHGDTSVTRMYHAVREDGHPKDHGWETESVTLAHPHEMNDFLNRSRDKKIAQHHIGDGGEYTEELHPRGPDGKWISAGASGFSKTLKEGDVPHEFVHRTEGGVVISVPNAHDLPSLESTAKSHGDFMHKGIGIDKKYYTFASTKEGGSDLDETPAEIAKNNEINAKAIAAEAHIDMQDLTKVAGKMGSNEGGVYESPFGDKYYVKTPKSQDHVQNELIAAKLYQLAGVRTMEYVPVKGGNHVATALQPLEKNNIAHFNADERHEAQKDFATHAWLANWDAAGTGGDNQVIIGGKVHTVDTGGSLKYRAQGEPKGIIFGDKVNEINTLRDPSKSPDAAGLYGNMTNDQLIASMKNVTSLSNQDISKTIYDPSNKMSSVDKGALLDKLIARKNDITNQMDSLIAKTATPAVAVTTSNTPPDMFAPVVKDIPDHEFEKLSSGEKVKHLLMKGTTSKELLTKLNWKAIGIPANAAALNLKLEKTQKNGVTHYKGTPMTAAEISAAKGEAKEKKAAKVGAAAAAAMTKVVEPKELNINPEPTPGITPKTSESFQNELEAKGIKNGGLTYHQNGTDLTISAPTPQAAALAEVAKNHPEWTLNQGMKSTYSAPKSAFEDTKHLVPPAKVAAAPAAKHDTSTPLGNFKQSLDEHGVDYRQGTGNSHSDYIDVNPTHALKAQEIAKWHPAVTMQSPETYAIAKGGTVKAEPSPVKAAPPPVPAHPPATDAELAKAKKNIALQLQYVPGAPDVAKAHELIKEFNKKYEGKTLTTPDELQAKVNAFKDLTAAMVPLQSEAQKAAAILATKSQAEQAAAHAKVLEAQAAKKAADKAAFEASISDPKIKAQYDKLHSIGVSGTASLDHQFSTAIKKLANTNHHITGADAAYISAYVGSAYDNLNESLWKGDKMNLKQSIYASALEKSLSKMPSYQGTAVRGVKTAGAFERYAENVGHVVTERGFSSYGATHKLWGSEATIHLTAIDLKDIRAFNSHEGGGELILPRGSMIHITKVNKKTREVWAEQIG